MKKLNYEEFFFKPKEKKDKNMKDNALGATIIITPKQVIEVYNQADYNSKGNLIEGLGTHVLTYNKLIANIYNLDYETDDLDYLEFILNNYNKNYLNDYIHICFVSDYFSTSYILSLPKYITSYEYRKLINLNNYLKTFNIHIIEVIFINGYDSIKNTYTDYLEFKSLDSLLNYYKNNNLIKDYNLYDNDNNIINERIIDISDNIVRK